MCRFDTHAHLYVFLLFMQAYIHTIQVHCLQVSVLVSESLLLATVQLVLQVNVRLDRRTSFKERRIFHADHRVSTKTLRSTNG